MIDQIKVGGIYRHYKGNDYKVLALSKSADDLSVWVVYETLYNNPVGKIWHRKLQEFVQVGQWQPGAPAQPRFVLIEDLIYEKNLEKNEYI